MFDHPNFLSCIAIHEDVKNYIIVTKPMDYDMRRYMNILMNPMKE